MRIVNQWRHNIVAVSNRNVDLVNKDIRPVAAVRSSCQLTVANRIVASRRQGGAKAAKRPVFGVLRQLSCASCANNGTER